MGMGPVCQTSLSTGLSEWELGPHNTEWFPIGRGAMSLLIGIHILKHFYAFIDYESDS